MPKISWISIVLDFIVKLLLLRDLITRIKYDFILVVIDRLIKYTYFIFYLKANIIEDLAYAFLRVIIINYSALEKIISNKNKLFILKFWKILIDLLGIKRKLSTSFYA
jgi:hypothetical protein